MPQAHTSGTSTPSTCMRGRSTCASTQRARVHITCMPYRARASACNCVEEQACSGSDGGTAERRWRPGGGAGGEAGGQLTARAKLDASSRRLLARAEALALGCPPASRSAARGAAQDLMQRGGAPGSQCVGGLLGALELAP